MRKYTILFLIILLVIIIGVAIGINGGSKEEKNTNKIVMIESDVENVFADIYDEKNKEQNVQNTAVVNEVVNNEEILPSETFREEPKTEQEKAIDIVKKDWGDTENVSITVDGVNNDGRYIISVRDKNTTEALAFYTVNVSDKTFSKREMN